MLGTARSALARLRQDPGLLRLLVAAAGIRLLLLPLSHTWDAQSWANVFAELARAGSPLDAINSPYETMRELSLLTQASGRHGDYYEYWAYPPLMLYLYLPLTHAYAALGGSLATSFPAQPAFVAPAIPVSLQFFVRVPVIVADLATLAIMRALGLGLKEVRWYAFNPFVLLVGVWTFDSVMVALFLLALLLAERCRWALAGGALALGALTKFLPLVALPALLLTVLSAEKSPAARVKALLATVLTTLVVLGGLTLPVLDGVQYILRFHATRFATGLTFEHAWRAWAHLLPNVDWQPRWQLYASVELGGLALIASLLAATWLLTIRPLPVSTGFLVLVAAFLAGSKVVNEPYALALVALLTVEAGRRASAGLRGCRTLIWVLAFCYAATHTPLWAFLFSIAQSLSSEAPSAIATWAHAYRAYLSYPEANLPLAVLGAAFSLTALATAWQAWRVAAPRAARSDYA